MVSYKIEIKRPAEKAIRKLNSKDRQRIILLIERLKSDPRPVMCEKLKGSKNSYRIRQGNYRVIYSVWDSQLVVSVIKVGHRREVYRYV